MATRILAVLNQKGGVGKTTTCVNLGAALARRGLRVLLVDMDPQANLTVHLGLEPSQLQRTTYSLLIGQHGLAEAVQKTGVPGLFVVPSTLALANAEIQLASTVGRELVLREALDEWLDPSPAGHDDLAAAIRGVAAGAGGSESAADSEPGDGPGDGDGSGNGRPGPGADFVLIDCPPSLGTLTMNALCASGEVLLPIQTEFFALQGVAGILESVRAVQRLNKGLRLSLVVPSLVDRRTTLARDVLDEVRSYFGDIVTKTEIRKNIKLAEAPSHGKTIFEWEPRCNGALDYESLAAEVLGESAPELESRDSAEIAADAEEIPDEPAEDVRTAESDRENGAQSTAVPVPPVQVLQEAPPRVADGIATDGIATDGIATDGESATPRPRSSGIGLAPDYADAGGPGASSAGASSPGASSADASGATTSVSGPGNGEPAGQGLPAAPAPANRAGPEQFETASAAVDRLPAVVRESIPAPPDSATPTAASGPSVDATASEATTTRMPVDAGTLDAATLDAATLDAGTLGTGTLGTGTRPGVSGASEATGSDSVGSGEPQLGSQAASAVAPSTAQAEAAPRTDESRASWWQSLRRNALRRDSSGS